MEAKLRGMINSRCESCEFWDKENDCCGNIDEFWETCARDADYDGSGSEYYDYDSDDEENTYYKELYSKCKNDVNDLDEGYRDDYTGEEIENTLDNFRNNNVDFNIKLYGVR